MMMTKHSDEMLRMFVGSMGALGMMYGLFPAVAQGALGTIFVFTALLNALLGLLVDVRHGAPFGKCVMRTLFVGTISFGGMYGMIWFLTVYLPTRSGLFQIKL